MDIKTINEWADFWYYTIGVTPLPVFSKNKNDHTKPLAKVKWTKYQTTELDEKIFEEWKSQNLFKDGIAIIGGFVYRGKNKGKYLIMIDCDNQKGIDELSPKGGLKIMLERTLVEQHKDRTDKAHIYFYSDKPVHKKVVSGNESSKEQPAVEVKGNGKHGIHIVTPSIHVDGSPYEITSIGITPAFVISLEEQIQKICDKFGIKYLDDESKFGYQQTQASKFMSPDFRIGESEGRRPALLSVCGHWFWERQERLNHTETYNEVLALSYEWNKLHCTVLLTESQIKKQCSDALKKAKYYVESGEMYPLSPADNNGKKENINSKKPKIDFYELATELMYEYNFISHISKEIYYYSKGIYHKNGDKLIKKKCRQYWESVGIETHHIREIENIIRDKTMILNEDENQDIFDNDYQKQILKNGIYDFKKMEFVDHTPDILATIKHPIFYNTTKSCPMFDEFLNSCFDRDEKRITQVWEMMALCFIKKTIIQKGYVNYGIGSNGKTTFLNILRNALGMRNTTSIPMQAFQKIQFMGYELRGKCANISGDGGTEPIMKTGFIKSLLGGDAIRCEEKFRNPFDYMPFVTLIFTFNELPMVNDSSDGFARKIQPIHWGNRFYGKNADPNIDKIAFDSDERSGIFNKLIPIIKRLIDTRKLRYENTVQETKTIWLSRSDSFFKFKNDHIVIGAGYRVEINKVKEYYKEKCDDNGMTPVTDSVLFNKISDMLDGQKPSRSKINDKSIRVWTGFTLDCELREPEQEQID